MKRLLTGVSLLAAAALVAGVLYAKEAPAPKSATVKGEIIDMGCYLAHGAKGEKHRECAAKCAAEGMPIGLLTDKGKLYLLTLNHDDADPYNKAKELAGQMAEVTGPLMERNGMIAVEVASIKPSEAAPAPAK